MTIKKEAKKKEEEEEEGGRKEGRHDTRNGRLWRKYNKKTTRRKNIETKIVCNIRIHDMDVVGHKHKKEVGTIERASERKKKFNNGGDVKESFNDIESDTKTTLKVE